MRLDFLGIVGAVGATLQNAASESGAAQNGAAESGVLGLFKQSTLYLASGVEAVAGLVIAVAVIEAAWRTARIIMRPLPGHDQQEDVRLHLGRWLALALEFELAADILRTAVAPTWNEIGQLAAIVVLRTVLNYFLQQEIDKAAQRATSANAAVPNIAAPSASVPGSALMDNAATNASATKTAS
jgi:uncharacterized membrane protein